MATPRALIVDLLAKYGKVAVGVHFSVSLFSIAGLYVAIKNNVDVQSLLDGIGMYMDKQQQKQDQNGLETVFGEEDTKSNEAKSGGKGSGSSTSISSGGALALAVVCNKALLPVRIPITVALTPNVARFLARRTKRV